MIQGAIVVALHLIQFFAGTFAWFLELPERQTNPVEYRGEDNEAFLFSRCCRNELVTHP